MQRIAGAARQSWGFLIGGIDDRTLGTPDWNRLTEVHGPPDLLLAHNPDDFYDAERRGVALMLSGHTHGGQIRFAAGPPIVRQSRFCLDEGLYVHGSTMLAVTRGLGAVGLPWPPDPVPCRRAHQNLTLIVSGADVRTYARVKHALASRSVDQVARRSGLWGIPERGDGAHFLFTKCRSFSVNVMTVAHGDVHEAISERRSR